MKLNGFKMANLGFSYIEMVFTVAILGMLAAAATPYLEKTIQRKKEAALRQNLLEIRQALDAYKRASDEGKIAKSALESGYPKSLELLAEGVADQSDPQRKPLRFLRKIPADPFFQADTQASSALNGADTWGKRSYASDYDKPEEGEDVYDIYSRNSNIGSNGLPYYAW